MINRNRFAKVCCLWAVLSTLAVPATLWADPRCSFVSYDRGARKLKVKIEDLPEKKKLFIAAALDRGAEGGLWIQVGQHVKASGEVELEAYDFSGKAVVYAARNGAGQKFLETAQVKAAKQKPTSAKAVAAAPVDTLCEFEVP